MNAKAKGGQGADESPGSSRASARLLTPRQAAELLGVPESTLAQWRSQRRGPPYVKLESRLIRYRVAHLEAYLAEHVVQPLDKGHAYRYAPHHGAKEKSSGG